MTDGPWSEGWPKVLRDDDSGEGDRGGFEVVPLSDAERLREELETSQGFRQIAERDWKETVVEMERLREALEGIGDKRVPKLLEKSDDAYVREWAMWAHEKARAALSQPVSNEEA